MTSCRFKFRLFKENPNIDEDSTKVFEERRELITDLEVWGGLLRGRV